MIVDAYGHTYSNRADSAKASSGARRLIAGAREEQFEQAIRSGYRNVNGMLPLNLMTQGMMHLYSFWMYYTNHLYGGIIEKKTDIICGDGFDFDSKSGDDATREIISAFWDESAINNFLALQDIYVAWLQIFGEVCFKLHTNPKTNDVTVGFIDPTAIESTITDANNPFNVLGVRLYGQTDETLTAVLDPTKEDEDLLRPYDVERRKRFRVTMADGTREQVFCLYRAFNPRVDRVEADGTPSLRGTPPLLSAIDPCRDAEDILHSMRRRADMASRILWDVTLTNAGEDDILDFLNETPIPDENTINAHNEQVSWNMIAPDLKASEHETEHRMVRNHAISGKGTGGMPPTWFADGTDVNRANGQEMPFASFKTLKKEQRKIGWMFRDLVGYQLAQKGKDPKDLKCIFPTISEKDYNMLAGMFAQLTGSLTVGENQKYITKEEGRQVYREVLQEFGTEIGEYEEPEEDDNDRMTEDYQRLVQEMRHAKETDRDEDRPDEDRDDDEDLHPAAQDV